MINWRKYILPLAARLTGHRIFDHIDYYKKMESVSSEEMESERRKKLCAILLHAYENVPYYKKLLFESGVICDGQVVLENFEKIAPMTKNIIRDEGENLYSGDHKGRKWFLNTSGGSTGESVPFIQDMDFHDWQMGCRFYYNYIVGKEVGEPEIKLWGSDRDVFVGAEKASTRLRRWLFNVTVLNSFVMTESDMAGYVEKWNSIRPKFVWAYATSIYEFAKYIKQTGKQVWSPACIVSTAEMLSAEIRGLVEEVFGCPVVNQYGSREVGVIASECLEKDGLHVFPVNNYVEILDDNLRPCKPGDMGDVYVTNLNNYSMPMIRYRIGDTAEVAEAGECLCGRLWPKIATVTGRVSDHFRTRQGKLIHCIYITHLFYGKDDIKNYRVIQHDYEDVEVVMVAAGKVKTETIREIEEKLKLVMGEDCRVAFREVEEIPRLASGKYRFTICELAQ